MYLFYWWISHLFFFKFCHVLYSYTGLYGDNFADLYFLFHCNTYVVILGNISLHHWSINQVFVAAKIWHCWECFVWFCRYEAGDHVAVYPVNDSELVDLIGKRLEVDLDQMFTLTNLDGGCRYLNVITLTLKDFKSLTLKKDAMYQKWIIPSERMLHVHFFCKFLLVQ